MTKKAHPDTSTIFVCGLLSFGFGPVMSVGNWYFGNRLLAKYDAEPERWTHRDLVVAGQWLGFAGGVAFVLWVLMLAVAR